MRAAASGSSFAFDLVVIGGGSGGVRASRIAAAHGARVALVEKQMHHGPPHYSAIGGTCVNVGCVPKKLMVYASRFPGEFHEAEGFGWTTQAAAGTGDNGKAARQARFSWASFMEKKNKEIDRLNGVYARLLGNANSTGGVEVIEGTGSLVDKHTVKIDAAGGAASQTLTAENILVCTGGWPHKPSIPGIEHAITSNEVFYLKEQPKKVLVCGGGFVAVEFACILHGLGSDVTLMYRGPLFLRGFDASSREHLAEELRKGGLNLQFNSNPSKIEKLANGMLRVTTEKGETSEYDTVMYATGRKAATKGIGLEVAGVKLGPAGEIVVDEWNRTNVSNIYAVGDVTGRVELTPVALKEGHNLADNLYAGKKAPAESGGLLGSNPASSFTKTLDYEYICSAVFSTPELGTVGYTEEAAAAKFKDLTVYTSGFRPMRNTISGAPGRTYMKVIVEDKTDRVVGVHIVGEGAGEMVQGVSIAVNMGATKADFDRTIGLHPTSLEEIVTMRSPSYHYKGGAKVTASKV